MILYTATNLLTAIIELIDDIDDAVTVQLSIAMASLSQTFDTTRNEIIAAMEQRIEKGDRTKLITPGSLISKWFFRIAYGRMRFIAFSQDVD